MLNGIKVCFFILLLWGCRLPANAAVRLPTFVSDGMVLQRSVQIPIWGWASPGEKITVIFNKSEYAATCGSDGKWQLKMRAKKAGGPYSMIVKGENKIQINDILIGDVWICSGQSNMGVRMGDIQTSYPQDLKDADYPFIRQFNVAKEVAFTPLQDIATGAWTSATPNTILGFTAVGYYFARELYNKYKVPIGLINTNWGGTWGEAWLSRDALIELPAAYDRKRDLDGRLWLRKEIDISGGYAQNGVRIDFSYTKNMDSIFFNGKLLGKIDTAYGNAEFIVPPSFIKERDNVLAVRVVNVHNIDWTETGVVYGKEIVRISHKENIIPQSGDWFYQASLFSQQQDPFPYARVSFIQNEPAILYNGMIAPFVPQAIKGVLWYQGESNVGNSRGYRKLLPALIQGWRKQWGLGDFPFLYVQLANFYDPVLEPGESAWAELRESQSGALSLPNTGMAVTHDIGDAKDIHPHNKKDVGKRLAIAAQKVAYREKGIVYSGPVYQSMKIKRNKIILRFNHLGSGLTVKGGGDLNHFSIAGVDKRFVWAKAKIAGNKVIVWSDQIASPMAVRYAWADNPEGANLYNAEGLPASSFRTDQ